MTNWVTEHDRLVDEARAMRKTVYDQFKLGRTRLGGNQMIAAADQLYRKAWLMDFRRRQGPPVYERTAAYHVARCARHDDIVATKRILGLDGFPGQIED